jgi:GNAT superfamily N-acetyltransferase
MPPRGATPADIPELVRLGEIMLVSTGGSVDAAWRRDAAAFLAANLQRADLAIFVVDDEHQPGRLAACGAGWLDMRLPGPLNAGGYLGHVQWMVTDPAHRRRGLARAVFSSLLDWFEAHGARMVDLHATPDAAGLYRSYGLSEVGFPNLRGPLSPRSGAAPSHG